MIHLEQTLAEQLQITDREIQKRKSLLEFSDADAETLKKHKSFITRYIDGIVKNFYDKQVAVPEISLLIGDAETLRRLQSAMRRYILELFDGHYDAEYVNKRLRIGKVHQRIGVSPKLYIAAIHILQNVLNSAIDMHSFNDKNNLESPRLKSALNKLLMFDIQFVIDTYISNLVSEVDSAKEELREYTNTLEDTVTECTKQLQEMSLTDSLTGLFNQRAFYDHLRRELAMAERYTECLSLCYLDLNGFKQLNDSEGHKAGEEVLALVGRITQECIRESDIGCRYGGDEFCIIFPRTGKKEAEQIVKRLIKKFEKTERKGISFSIGIVDTGPEDFEDTDSLVKAADKLMYQSKRKSKKKQGFYITSSK